MSHRPFKDRVYHQFARVGQALASEKRLEIIDLLAQSPRNVDALAAETEQSLANISQHLQVLRAAHLVETERYGTRIIYRLADPSVISLWLSLRSVAEKRLAEIDAVTREFLGDRSLNLAGRDELAERLARDDVFLIDVRPSMEFDSGHIPGAVRMPIEELPQRLAEIPRDRPVIAYCRGEYCLFADEAVALLREHGIDAARLDGGWPEWSNEGRPTTSNGKQSAKRTGKGP
jgi:rhodanese-related sulfurtransferase/DNA-binding transcriptional ArsR family regulator